MGLHPLLASRFSPTRFDTTHVVSRDDTDLLLEAARWAPSAGNSQPWAFVVGRRGDDVHARLVRHLRGSVAGWAPSTPSSGNIWRKNCGLYTIAWVPPPSM